MSDDVDHQNPSSAAERLSASPEPLKALVHALLDDLLDRPVDQLLDRRTLPADITEAFRGVVTDPSNIAWLSEQLSTALAHSRQSNASGGVSERLPQAVREPLRKLATQPLVLNQQLATALLDHPAFQGLVRELLTKSLLSYSKQVAELIPGGKTLTGLMGRARGMVASGLGDTTAGLEQRATQFVEDTLAPSINRAASYLAEDQSAASLADWRGHILETLLDRPEAELMALVERAEPEVIAAEVAALMAALAAWPALEDKVSSVLEGALDATQGKSLRQLMQGHRLEQQLRPMLETTVVEAVWPFFQGQAFAQWCDRYLSDS